MSPEMHVCDALMGWASDHREIQWQHEERMRQREAGARAAVLRVAALSLCAELGHDRRLRGCQECRDAVAEVWR